MELWKALKEEPNFEVSNRGNVRHRKFKRNRKFSIKYGYPNITLGKNKNKYLVHRLVAKYFLDNFDNELDVDHKNRVRHDNRVENLQMVTRKQNCANRIPSIGLVEHIIDLHRQGFSIKEIYDTVNR